MKMLGTHLIAEYADCERELLDNLPALEEYMNEAVRQSGATIVSSVFHRYNPHGVSGVIVIAESHFSIHTWPEYGYAAVDFFTCGDVVKPRQAFELMKTWLSSQRSSVIEIARGIPSDSDEVIQHKPMLRANAPAS